MIQKKIMVECRQKRIHRQKKESVRVSSHSIFIMERVLQPCRPPYTPTLMSLKQTQLERPL